MKLISAIWSLHKRLAVAKSPYEKDIVQRQIEASYLRLPYSLDREKAEGRIVIDAAWKPYTRRELWEREQETERLIDEAEEFGQ